MAQTQKEIKLLSSLPVPPSYTGPARPLAASANGITNAFTFRCVVVNQQRHYAACLHLIHRRETEGSLSGDRLDCDSAIRGDNCPALRLQQAEKEAGHAIFFVERIRVGDTLKKANEILSVPVQQAPAKVDSVAAVLLGNHDGADINAQVVNHIAKETVVKPQQQAASGESLMDIARRMLKEKEVSQT